MIMKNYFMKSSMMLMAVSAALASCTQEDVLQNTPAQPSDNELKLSVSTQDFVSDAQGRAITNNDKTRTSKFENGDQMGLYIFSEDREVLCDNLLYTYTDGKWTTDKTIYQYKNAQYVAYFPYCKDLSGVTGAESITEYFKVNILSTVSQTNAETYEQADLMIATTSQVDGSNVNLTLAHQFSMIELNIPCRKYITSATDGFQYAAPVKMKVEINEKTELYRAADGVYRMIVAPGTTPTIVGSVEYDENMPINFSSKSEGVTMNALAAGTFTQFNVTYTDPAVQGLPVDDATGRYIRPLQPGDYYYSDGTIYPYTEETVDQPITEGCIGVIFEVGTGAPGTDWTHGSVLALNNAHKDWTRWGDTPSRIDPVEGNGSNGLSGEEEFSFLKNKMDGYQMSKILTRSGDCALNKVDQFETTYPQYIAPDGISSGWYVPSSGQLLAIMENLGDYQITLINYKKDTDNGTAKKNALDKVQKKIETVGGTFWDEDDVASNAPQCWWSTTEQNTDNIWAIEWNRDTSGNSSTGLLTRNKYNAWDHYSTRAYARPILSF
jgi:hypothetical protein